MGDDNAAVWDRHAAAYQAGAALPTDVVTYGPDIPTEADLRLLGNVDGKRVVELGCGGAQCSIALARQGASVTGVDFSAQQLDFARELCARNGVRVEFRQGDLADLAFLADGSVDIAFSAYAFGFVEDLDRVFQAVHRILRVGGALVFSMEHPSYDLIDEEDPDEPLLVRRSYFDRSPVRYFAFTEYHRTMSDLHSGLTGAGFVVDALAEPEPLADGPRTALWRDAFRLVPPTVIMRAVKPLGAAPPG